jgi:hypothetical protein
MNVCSVCLESNAPRSCRTCTTHMHLKCRRKLCDNDPSWRRKCIVCRTKQTSPLRPKTRSMTQRDQSNAVLSLIRQFESTENLNEKFDILEEIFDNFYQNPLLLRIPGVKSMVCNRLIGLHTQWPRASYYYRIIIGGELHS